MDQITIMLVQYYSGTRNLWGLEDLGDVQIVDSSSTYPNIDQKGKWVFAVLG